MDIDFKEVTVQELTAGYKDHAEDGVVGYGGRLNIRPPYQREFVYKNEQRDAVMHTLTQGFPLNVMYWAVGVNKDAEFEMIDGQQRTLSICQYVNGDYAFMLKYFNNLPDDEQAKILAYRITVYLCSGKDSEKLKWFETINIAGEKLTKQELRNAVYSGSWVTDAKRHFSKSGCPASAIGSDYLTGSAIRQEYLETAIKWISKDVIEHYMAKHQHDANAHALWSYFQTVIGWVEATFPNKRKKYMKGVDWGGLYNLYHETVWDAQKLEKRIAALIMDDDVTKKSGVYWYVLSGDEKHLSIRAFTDSVKQKVYEKQGRKCKQCGVKFAIEDMEGDHINPWHKGGKTEESNCQMLCKQHNREKGGK